MKISVTFQNDVLEIQKKGDGLQAEIWQKKLEDFEFKKNISTGMTVENKKLRKILFWKPIEDNILMVYTRTGEIKACYAPSRGAYLRVLERVCNVQHISLTKAGLSLQLQVGVVSDKELSFGEAALVIGERIRQPFDMPVSSKSLDKVKKDDPFFIRKFHFDLDELTREMEETSSRFDIAIRINGLDVTFPVKIEVPDEIEKYQHVPMISFFHKDHAVQIKHTLVGNVLFVCRPMEEVEKTRSFRFWESEPVSGWLYRRGRKEKERSDKKVSLFYEKFCQKAEEGTFEIFDMAWKRNPEGAYFIINEKSPDYAKIKDHPNVVKQYSKKYYELLFRANTYISTETPFHLNVIRSNNKYYRRSIAENTFVFLQHGVTYMKCHGPNSPFLAGREMEPDYIVVNSEKEKAAVHRMMGIDESRILKTGMGIFSKIAYKHLNEDSEDMALIMLTWKPYEDNMEDFTKSTYYQNTMAIYQMLREYLPAEKIRVVIHPKTGAHLEKTELAPSIWRGPISEALQTAKLLITDYSSVCYNSFYQGGGVVFFQEDLKFYEKENGKLIPKDDEYIGRRIFSLPELKAVLEEGCRDGRIHLDYFRTEEFERRYHSINEFSDGKNMERLCEKLIELGLI